MDSLESIYKLDKRLFAIGTKIEIIKRLRWNKSVGERFLKAWRAGNPRLPRVGHSNVRQKDERAELKKIIKKCKGDHEIIRIIRETAESYLLALGLVESVGTPAFLEFSKELYGAPHDRVGVGSVTTHRAALRFLRMVRSFNLDVVIPEELFCITPGHVVSQIKRQAKRTFPDKRIKVTLDKNLASKASASPNRIKIRAATCFAKHDIEQLIQHELLVHSLTLHNGRKQRIKTLGLASPRTTTSQEGLAVFAEFITNCMDVSRLRRISARVRAIQMGIEGADFLEVFRFFLEHGQSEEESYYSTQRVFRGGKVTGGTVFTKDLVYLRGFIEVHRFFTEALKDEKFMFPKYLFSGRLQPADIVRLEQHFATGLLRLPKYLPEWIADQSTLLAFLLSSSVMNTLGLSKVVR